MKKSPFYLFLLFILLAFASCKSYSNYTIDATPITKVDTNLYGIWKLEQFDKLRLFKAITWKASDDTASGNFILFQSPEDLVKVTKRWNSMSDIERLAILDSNDRRDSFRVQSILYRNKAEDDMRTREEMKKAGQYYYVTYFDANGRNPHYQQWDAFISGVNGLHFLNISYRYAPGFDDDKPKTNPQVEGFFFVRIISMSPKSLVTAVVADPTLKDLKSSAAVRERIAKHVNDPRFYSDTLHFYKVSDYHESLNEAMKRANP